MYITLDRQEIYQGVTYEIIEVLTSDMLLAVPKVDFDKGEFPLTPVVIPGR